MEKSCQYLMLHNVPKVSLINLRDVVRELQDESVIFFAFVIRGPYHGQVILYVASPTLSFGLTMIKRTQYVPAGPAGGV